MPTKRVGRPPEYALDQDGAAILVQSAINLLDPISEDAAQLQPQKGPKEIGLTVTLAIKQCERALRLLERHGAPTKPTTD